ncbi:MAG: hypothetical protein K8T91_07120 [Planctomycetes bacterium]|nr:hypothetical protein [Planctomycetota bacterium]
MTDEQNPYAAPQIESLAHSGPAAVDSDAERIRKLYLNYESSLRASGLFYMFAGGVGFCLAMASLAGKSPLMGIVGGALGIAMILMGVGLFRLDPKVVNPARAVAAVSLLAFPCGTVLGIFLFYLVLSHKGKTILSPNYEQIRRQTPHIQPKQGTRLGFWIIVAIVFGPMIGFLVWTVLKV